MDIKNYMLKIGTEAKKASFVTASASSLQKNKFLNNLGHRILKNEVKIINVNKKDLIQAVKDKHDNAFIDRLTLNEKNIKAMASASGIVRMAAKKKRVAPIRHRPRPTCNTGRGATSTLPPCRHSAIGNTSRK